MDETEKKLLQEVRDDVKALTVQVAAQNAQVGTLLKRVEHDTSLVKRTVFGTERSIGLVREVDRIGRDLDGRVSVLESAAAQSKADRRKLFMTFMTTMIVGATGWLIAAIQQFMRP